MSQRTQCAGCRSQLFFPCGLAAGLPALLRALAGLRCNSGLLGCTSEPTFAQPVAPADATSAAELAEEFTSFVLDKVRCRAWAGSCAGMRSIALHAKYDAVPACQLQAPVLDASCDSFAPRHPHVPCSAPCRPTWLTTA